MISAIGNAKEREQNSEKYIAENSGDFRANTVYQVYREYEKEMMFPVFDGLIPEGWLLDIASDSWKIDRRDRMQLLMCCCKDCIGDLSIIPFEDGEE